MPGLHQVAANAFGDPCSGILDGIACAGTSGIVAHTGLAGTLAGRPLGLFELNAAFRGGKTVDGMEPGPEVNDKESARWLRGLDRTATLSAACPGTRVVNICDPEDDFRELLRKAASDGARLLVRASRSSQRQVILEGGPKRISGIPLPGSRDWRHRRWSWPLVGASAPARSAQCTSTSAPPK